MDEPQSRQEEERCRFVIGAVGVWEGVKSAF